MVCASRSRLPRKTVDPAALITSRPRENVPSSKEFFMRLMPDLSGNLMPAASSKATQSQSATSPRWPVARLTKSWATGVWPPETSWL